jgi:hypothetical protein
MDYYSHETRRRNKPSLSDLVERIRVTLGNNEKVWSEILNISEQDYADFRSGRKQVSILSLSQLAQHLELTLESLMSGNIDFKILVARQKGDVIQLPDRYRVAARSRKRASVNLLNATEEFFGWQARVFSLRHLQVTEAAFLDLDEAINVRFNTDLCDYLHRNYGGTHHFYDMGAYSVITNYNTPVGKLMAQNTRLEDLYQFFVEEMLVNHWERNFKYELTRLTPTSCRIESYPNQDVAHEMGVRNPGSPFLCQTKVGVTACVPGYLSLPFANVRETACVHRGDPRCVLEVDYEFAAKRSGDKDARRFRASS